MSKLKYATEVVRELLVDNTVYQLKTAGIKIKASKGKKLTKKLKMKKNSTPNHVFGQPIGRLQHKTIDKTKQITIPTFLISLCEKLENGGSCDSNELLLNQQRWREKEKSLGRIQRIKKTIDDNNSIDFDGATVFDIACILKQFLQELPDPLISKKLQKSFLKTRNVVSDVEERRRCVLLLCLLMPLDHVNVLRYFMMSLKRVTENTKLNMNEITLSLLMTPALWQYKEKESNGDVLHPQFEITIILINNADQIGFISYNIDSSKKTTSLFSRVNNFFCIRCWRSASPASEVNLEVEEVDSMEVIQVESGSFSGEESSYKEMIDFFMNRRNLNLCSTPIDSKGKTEIS